MSSPNADRRLRESLSPEEQVLLLSVRDESDPAAIAALLARSDLTRLLYVAVSERATAVLWPRIASLLDGRNATEVQALQRTARVSEFRLLLLEDRLASTVAALGALSTPPLLLKGAALATATYRTFAERPMGDLDVLIAREDATDAQRLLGGAGWRAEASAPEEVYAHHHHLPMISDAAGAKLSIELHTELFFEGNPFGFGAAQVRAAAVPVAVRGRPALVPSPVHQLLHCALHFAWSHRMGEGAWRTFRDVRAIISRPAPGGDRFDWDGFVAAAVEARGATSAYWTLRLARSLAKLEVPDAVTDALRPPGSDRRLARLERHFAMNAFAQHARCPSEWLARRLWEVGIRPSWSGHGTARPWMWDGQFVPAGVPAPTGPLDLATRVRFEADRASRWAVYVRQVLAGAAGRTS